MGVARSHLGGSRGMPPQNIFDALRVNLAHLEMLKGHSDCIDNLKYCSFAQPPFYTRRCRACHHELEQASKHTYHGNLSISV